MKKIKKTLEFLNILHFGILQPPRNLRKPLCPASLAQPGQPAQLRAPQSGSAWLPASLLPLCPASLAQPGQPAQLRAAQSGSAQLPASAWEIVCLAARLPEPYSPSSGPLQQSKGTSIHYILYTIYYLLSTIYYILSTI